jgi:hypothetical protein
VSAEDDHIPVIKQAESHGPAKLPVVHFLKFGACSRWSTSIADLHFQSLQCENISTYFDTHESAVRASKKDQEFGWVMLLA